MLRLVGGRQAAGRPSACELNKKRTSDEAAGAGDASGRAELAHQRLSVTAGCTAVIVEAFSSRLVGVLIASCLAIGRGSTFILVYAPACCCCCLCLCVSFKQKKDKETQHMTNIHMMKHQTEEHMHAHASMDLSIDRSIYVSIFLYIDVSICRFFYISIH